MGGVERAEAGGRPGGRDVECFDVKVLEEAPSWGFSDHRRRAGPAVRESRRRESPGCSEMKQSSSHGSATAVAGPDCSAAEKKAKSNIPVLLRLAGLLGSSVLHCVLSMSLNLMSALNTTMLWR